MALGDVEVVVRKWKFQGVADMEGGVIVSTCLGGGTREFDLRRFHVDAMQFAGFNCPGKADRNCARSAAEVENANARLQMREEMGGMAFEAAAV